MGNLKFNYDNPTRAVFLRILAWEIYEAGRELKVRDVVSEQVQSARNELGLKPFDTAGGGAQDFINKLREGAKPLLTAKHQPPSAAEVGWKDEWRLLNLPSHFLVRSLSQNPIVEKVENSNAIKADPLEFKISLRHPALPSLRLFIGTKAPKKTMFNALRGIYFLRLPSDKLYIGKSDEFHTRFSDHGKNKLPSWWIFIAPEGVEQTYTLDTLNAAESLLISFWNEIADVKNNTRGGDQKPAFIWLQQAVLLTEAASAVFLWALKEKKQLGETNLIPDWSIPFKKWRGEGWPGCYTSNSPVHHKTQPVSIV